MTRMPGVVAILVIGCGEDVVHEPLEPAPLAEVCGAAGPVQLLALGADERVGNSFAVTDDGERLLFVAGKAESIPPSGYPALIATKVHAVGPCGEDPVVVAGGVTKVYTEPSFPGVVFGCAEGRDLVRIDPSGGTAAQMLARGVCEPEFTEHGLLTYVDGGDGWHWTVDFYPLLDAEEPRFGAPIRLAEPVKIVNSVGGNVRIVADEVLMVEDGELASYSVPDRERTVLAHEVVMFQVSEDGRFLFCQGQGSGGDELNPVGPIYAMDRESGVSGPIGTGVLMQAAFFGADFFAVDVIDGGEHQRLVSLPEYEFVEVPEGHDVSARLADGRWLTSRDHNGPWHVFDAEDGSVALVSEDKGRTRGPVEEHLDLVLSTDWTMRGMGAYVRHFYDGRAPRTLAERANSGAFVRGDSKVLTMVDVDDEALGTLTVADPATTKGLFIDDRVVTTTSLERWSHPTEEGAVIYGVVDGERTGVWVARPE